jgi:hypothetical protein
MYKLMYVCALLGEGGGGERVQGFTEGCVCEWACRIDSDMLYMKPVYLLIVGRGGGIIVLFYFPPKVNPNTNCGNQSRHSCIIYEALRQGQSIIQEENIPSFCHKS